MKLKIVAIYSVLVALTLAIGICVFFFYFKKSRTENPEAKQEPIEAVGKQEADIIHSTHKDENLESELNKIKADIVKTIEDQKSAKQLYKNEDYTQIMLTLSLIETKLYRGGNIKNEIIRLKSLSLKHPDLLLIVKNFESISSLSSRKDLKEQYEDYVKIAKSELLSKQTSKFEKVMGFISKYFTILSQAQEEDKLIIEMGEYLNDDDFIRAYEALNSLNIKSPEVQVFADNLKNANLVQSGINDIYFTISTTINEGNNSGR